MSQRAGISKMVALTLNREPRVLSLAGGDVTITVRYADMVTHTAARAKAEHAARQLEDGGAILEELGYRPEEMVALEDPDVLMGFSALLYAVELGALIIESWTGVEDGQGNPVPVNRESIAAVMREVGTDFIAAEARNSEKVILAGNVFSPSLNGTGAGAGNIVKAAGPKAQIAAGENGA